MRVLLVKLTSMGDLIHALPAITDASRAIPGITFDWVVDKNFSEVAQWHPAVKNIITTRHRHWRKNLWASIQNGEILQFIKSLRREKYDLIIDGQSSTKSALVTLMSRGISHGLDRQSASEGWITPIVYQKSYFIEKNLHAIKRLRLLFAKALNYSYQETQPAYGIRDYPFPALKFDLPNSYLVFVHNASWSSKLWPEGNWRRLIELAAIENFSVLLPWGNLSEKQRAERIAADLPTAQVLPFCTLSEQARILKNSMGAICSDTGLCHLAASLDVPSVTLYGSTDPALIGTIGRNQLHLASTFSCTRCYQFDCNFGNQKNREPICFKEITPETAWKAFRNKL